MHVGSRRTVPAADIPGTYKPRRGRLEPGGGQSPGRGTWDSWGSVTSRDVPMLLCALRSHSPARGGAQAGGLAQVRQGKLIHHMVHSMLPEYQTNDCRDTLTAKTTHRASSGVLWPVPGVPRKRKHPRVLRGWLGYYYQYHPPHKPHQRKQTGRRKRSHQAPSCPPATPSPCGGEERNLGLA